MELKVARRIARLSQGELAKRAGVDIATVCRLEANPGTRRPSYETIVRLARALNLAPDELFPVPPLDPPIEPIDDETERT